MIAGRAAIQQTARIAGLALVLAAAARPQAAPPVAAPAAVRQAQQLLNAGHPTQAVRQLRAYLLRHPASALARFQLGYALFRRIQLQARTANPRMPLYRPLAAEPVAERTAVMRWARASLAQFTAGAKYARPTAFDLQIVALDYVLLGDEVDAAKWLQVAVQWEPGNAHDWYLLGRVRYVQNRFPQAAAAFRKSLRLQPLNPLALDNLGLAEEAMDHPRHAAAAYRRAIASEARSGQRNPAPAIDLGRLLLTQNQPAAAATALRRAVAMRPNVGRAHRLLGQVYLRLRQFSRAARQLKAAERLDPASPTPHYLLAMLYRAQGQPARARRQLQIFSALRRARAGRRK